MTITESLKFTLSKYVVFQGRASRREWVIWFLATFILSIVISSLVRVTTGDSGTSPLAFLQALVWLGLFLPTLAVHVRRLHDTGKSGGMFLLVLIPIAGPFILLFLMLQAGQPVANVYGEVVS